MKLLSKLTEWFRREKSKHSEYVGVDVTKREFLKRAVTAGLLVGAASLGINVSFAQMYPNIVPKKVFDEETDELPFAKVYLKGSKAIARDEKDQTIIKSEDHAKVIQDAIDYVSPCGEVFIGPGRYYIKRSIIIDEKLGHASIILKGAGTTMGYYTYGTVLYAPADIIDNTSDEYTTIAPVSNGKTAPILFIGSLKGAVIRDVFIWSDYYTGILARKTTSRDIQMLYLEHVMAQAANGALIIENNGGSWHGLVAVSSWFVNYHSNGKPIVLRGSGRATFLGCALGAVNTDYNIIVEDPPDFTSATQAGNSVFIFGSSISVPKYPTSNVGQGAIYVNADPSIPIQIHVECCFMETLANAPFLHVVRGNVTLYVRNNEIAGAGNPFIKVEPGAVVSLLDISRNERTHGWEGEVRVYVEKFGISILSGDGTTTDFLLGQHKLNIPYLTSPDKALVECTPASSDAIAASPVVCYLSDEDGDGIYESIRAKFASAPAAGTDNVRVVWYAKYIG